MFERFRERLAPAGWGNVEALPLENRFPKGYDGEAEAARAVVRVEGHTLLSYERAVTLYQQARYLEETRVGGAFVECGVYKGGAVGILAIANLEHGARRRELHLFDSFQGLPEPSRRDGARNLAKAEATSGRSLDGAGALVPVEWDRAAREDCERLFTKLGYPSEHLHYHEGWFQQTLAMGSSIGDIALLRLDGDWYESTKVCLEALYPYVVPGGFVVIDDYGHHEGCRAAVDEYLAGQGIQAYLHHIDYTGRYLVKPG